MSANLYDVIIVGGGAAGLTTAIYTSRGGMRTLVLEKSICGGIASTTELIENYPGFPEGINGMDLMQKFKSQAIKFGTEIKEFKEVEHIELKEELIYVSAKDETFSSSTLVIASGSIPKRLNVPGEDKFFGRGVSYCATCDGPLYRDKNVAVIGCGNSGLQEGLVLAEYVKSITFIEFLPYMNAEQVLQDRVKKLDNSKILLNHQLLSINGDENVKSITLKDRDTGEEKEFNVDGIFVYVGFLPNTSFLRGIVELDQIGYVKTDENMRTNINNIYAVGDVRSKSVRQIDVACAEGTIAAVSIREHLRKRIIG